jgi:hypothetical protein
MPRDHRAAQAKLHTQKPELSNSPRQDLPASKQSLGSIRSAATIDAKERPATPLATRVSRWGIPGRAGGGAGRLSRPRGQAPKPDHPSIVDR